MQSSLNNLQNFPIKKSSAWSRFWAGWYRISSPADPPPDATLDERETVRRARVNSIVLLILFIFNIPSFPSAIYGPNKALLILLLILIVIVIISVYLNRIGSVNTVGTLIWISFSASIMTNIVTTPGGFSFTVIPLFMLLILPQTLASVMLPPIFVFAAAGLNILFCILAVNLMPRPASMNALMPIAYSNGVFLPITVLGITAGISFLAQNSLGRALRERDRAQEIIRLERNLSQQADEMARRKEQLEQSIAMIIQTQTQVANGNLNAQVPLTAENVLWPVAGTLNNLISRLRRAQSVERELELTKQSANALINSIRTYKAGQMTNQYRRTGTVVDPIAMEIFRQEQPQAPRLHD